MRALPTPDFYEYPWTPIERVDVDGRFATIRWADGAVLEAFDWWLLENAVGLGFDLATREHLLDPAELSSDMAVESAFVSDDGALQVTFANIGNSGSDPGLLMSAPTAEFHPGWLRHVADGNHTARSWLPEPVSWTSATFSEPPTYDGSVVLDDDAVFGAWLCLLYTSPSPRDRG